jgi:hypothetical protein
MVTKDVVGELGAIPHLDIVEMPPLLLAGGANPLKLPTPFTVRLVVIPTTHGDEDDILACRSVHGAVSQVLHEEPRLLAIIELKASKISDAVLVIEGAEFGKKPISIELVAVPHHIAYRISPPFQQRGGNIERLVPSRDPGALNCVGINGHVSSQEIGEKEAR